MCVSCICGCRDSSVGAGTWLSGVGLPAGGESSAQEVWEGTELARTGCGWARQGWHSPACSIWKADLLGHGRRDSNADQKKKTFHIWIKSPERPRLTPLPRPPALASSGPSLEPCLLNSSPAGNPVLPFPEPVWPGLGRWLLGPRLGLDMKRAPPCRSIPSLRGELTAVPSPLLSKARDDEECVCIRHMLHTFHLGPQQVPRPATCARVRHRSEDPA